MNVDVKIAVVAGSQHGIVHRSQARRCGASDRQIRLRLESGEWQKLHRHVFLVRPAPLTLAGRALAATMAAGPGSVAVGITGLHLLGLVDNTPDIVEILARRRCRIDGVKVYVDTELPERSRISVNRVPIAKLEVIVFYAAKTLSGASLGQVLDAARQRGMKMHRLQATTQRLGGQGSRGAGCLRKQMEMRMRQGIRDSDLESMFVPHLLRRRIKPQMQYRIFLGDEYIRRGDFVIPEVKVDAETDGYQHEGRLDQWRRDREIDRRLMAAGWLVPRFTYWDILERPREAADELAALVRRRRKEFGLD